MTKSISPARAIIFDCDGTLVNTLPLYAAAWKQAFGSIGIEMTREWYLQRVGLSATHLVDAMQLHEGRQIDQSTVLANLSESMLSSIGEVEEVPGIAALARNYAGRLPMAVASSGAREIVHASLKAVGLFDIFATVVTTEDVKKPKPWPHLFYEASRRLGVEPDGCVVLEDSEEGLAAAEAANMRAIDVRRLRQDWFNDSGLEPLTALLSPSPHLFYGAKDELA